MNQKYFFAEQKNCFKIRLAVNWTAVDQLKKTSSTFCYLKIQRTMAKNDLTVVDRELAL